MGTAGDAVACAGSSSPAHAATIALVHPRDTPIPTPADGEVASVYATAKPEPRPPTSKPATARVGDQPTA